MKGTKGTVLLRYQSRLVYSRCHVAHWLKTCSLFGSHYWPWTKKPRPGKQPLRRAIQSNFFLPDVPLDMRHFLLKCTVLEYTSLSCHSPIHAH